MGCRSANQKTGSVWPQRQTGWSISGHAPRDPPGTAVPPLEKKPPSDLILEVTFRNGRAPYNEDTSKNGLSEISRVVDEVMIEGDGEFS